MIVTVTYNPSLDYFVRLPSLSLGETNRADTEEIYAGGKGVNVALVLKNMGLNCRAMVFTAGFVGAEIERRLLACGLDCAFIRAIGNNRINVKIKGKEETEINGIGAAVTCEHTEELIEKLSLLKKGDWLDLSGNTALGTDANTYVRLMSAINSKVRVAVDAHGELLRSVLPFKPYLVKPNLDELCGLFGKKLTLRDVPHYALKLQKAGARNVIVSLGSEGAVLAAEDGGLYLASPPVGKLVSSTGSGDSMVAGFITACEEGKNSVEAFRFAVAAGSACAFGEVLANRSDTEKLLNQCTATKIELSNI